MPISRRPLAATSLNGPTRSRARKLSIASPNAPTPGKMTMSAASTALRSDVISGTRPATLQACSTLNKLPRRKSTIAVRRCSSPCSFSGHADIEPCLGESRLQMANRGRLDARGPGCRALAHEFDVPFAAEVFRPPFDGPRRLVVQHGGKRDCVTSPLRDNLPDMGGIAGAAVRDHRDA